MVDIMACCAKLARTRAAKSGSLRVYPMCHVDEASRQANRRRRERLEGPWPSPTTRVQRQPAEAKRGRPPAATMLGDPQRSKFSHPDGAVDRQDWER